MNWIKKHPRATYEMLGFISENNPNKARKRRLDPLQWV
jgi:hypothetical protein